MSLLVGQRGRAALAVATLGLLLSLPLGAQDSARVRIEFDGDPLDPFQVTGSWSIERRGEWVRSGTGALAARLDRKATYPKIQLTSGFAESRHKKMAFDIGNPSDAPLALWLRLDDAESGELDDQRLRRKFEIPKGFQTITLDLDALTTPSGRKLDPSRLTQFQLYLVKPKQDTTVLLDALRVYEPRPELESSKSLLTRFQRDWNDDRPYAEQRAAILSLLDVDGVARVRALGRAVIQTGDDTRLTELAIWMLGNTTDTSAVEEVIRLAEKSVGFARWRWMAALGRMNQPLAREALLGWAKSSPHAGDRAVAVTVSARRSDAGFVHRLERDDEPSWSVRAAKVRCLRELGTGDGFVALTGYLTDPTPRVRLDAQEGLAALSGRDLGDNVEAWLDWWKVNRHALAVVDSETRLRNPYGTYYGLPLTPGRVAFVLDMSGSMLAPLSGAALDYVTRSRHLAGSALTTRLDLAKAELMHALRSLPNAAEFDVHWFDAVVRSWSGRAGLRSASATHRSDAIATIEGLSANPRGPTNLWGGLERALIPDADLPLAALLRDAPDTIFLLSDGDPSAGTIVDRERILATLYEQWRPRQVKVHTIGIGVQRPELLVGIARLTGGRYVDLR